MPRIPRLFLLLALAVAAVALPSGTLVGAPLHAQQTDVIRGRIVGQDSTPIENVAIVVTSLSGNVNRTSRSDKNGRFTVTFPNGDGDYMVTMTALGYAVKRFQVKRVSDEEFLLADARLSKVGAVLDQVNVTAERQRVSRAENERADISGTERRIETNPALPPDMMGDLAALAASLPGVQLVPGQDGGANGFSVLGLGADQNNTTLNGMNFGGAGLPRDAGVGTSLVTSPYDVSRGGFSGAQMSLRSFPGSNFSRRGLSTVLEQPQMQWVDQALRSTGAQYSNTNLGGSVSGPLKMDKAFYNMSYQLGRRENDLQTLLNTAPSGLQASGVAQDSVARLLSLLNAARVPTAYAGLPGGRLQDMGSVFGAIDFTPPTSNSGSAYNLTFLGNWSKQNPVGSGGFPGVGGIGGLSLNGGGGGGTTTMLPTAFGERTNWGGGLQARHSGYYRNMFLSETSVGINASGNSGEPYVLLPGGRVRVNSNFSDGTSGVQSLTFGGNQQLGTSMSSNSVAAMNTLSWFSGNNKHRLKLGTEFRRDGNSQNMTTNQLGTYTFNSLADLQANNPSSFTRQLTPRNRESGIMIGALSLGDSYRRSQTFQLQYGLRIDANQFEGSINRNTAVEQAFGVRNDRAPNGVYFSPRLGFSWNYGTAAQIGPFAGAFRGPRAVVRGGVGVFQNMPQATQIGSAIDNTGLPSAVQQLFCVGPATPRADWSSFAQSPSNIPGQCADGTNGTVFANSAPNVSLFAKDYMPSRSVRSNLSWTGAVLANRFNLSLEGTYSWNMNQGSFVDLNFAGDRKFSLADEGNRPVYVQPSSIVPSTGAIAPADARRNNAFARVTEQRSDLNSESRQISARLSPMSFSSGLTWNLAYVYSNVRDQQRGFQSTANDPRSIDWARSGFDSRHQIQYSLGYNFFDFLRVNWFGSVRSGTPFTPVIAGDVNGDGYSNDRAYVFDPSSASDPTVAAAMQQLLSTGSRAARECLESQIGRIASRNSCQGPWSHTASLGFSFNPLKIRLPQRATLSFNVTNPLGAADLMINGERKLRGWGNTPFADPSLLYVRGFDAASGKYKYEVNQRFGATNPAFNISRQPVTVSANLRFDIGATREKQTLTQQLDRGRRLQGTKPSEAQLKAQLSFPVLNPLAAIMRDQDTLKLTVPQADSIATMNRRLNMALDSIWSPIAKHYADLPNDFDKDEVFDRYRRARESSIDLLIKVGPAIKSLLTADQKRRLSPMIQQVLDKRYLVAIRSGTAGSAGAGMSMAGGPMMMMGGGLGGGGTQTIIMR